MRGRRNIGFSYSLSLRERARVRGFFLVPTRRVGMQSNPASGNQAFSIVSLSRRFNLMPVPTPATAILSFASPRQLLHTLLYLLHPCSRKKRHPDAAFILRSEGFDRGFPKGHPSPYEKRDASLHRPDGQITRYILVPHPSGATHANRQSCRFVRPNPPVLGAA
jgi:hypothetical protein